MLRDGRGLVTGGSRMDSAAGTLALALWLLSLTALAGTLVGGCLLYWQRLDPEDSGSVPE